MLRFSAGPLSDIGSPLIISTIKQPFFSVGTHRELTGSQATLCNLLAQQCNALSRTSDSFVDFYIQCTSSRCGWDQDRCEALNRDHPLGA
jgi:hypothetical protein